MKVLPVVPFGEKVDCGDNVAPAGKVFREMYTPGELKKLKRVKVFVIGDTDEDTAPVAAEKIVHCKDRGDVIAKTNAFLKESKGQLYTGIHKENDWSRTAWWEMGWHLVNRTGEYAVVW